MNVTNILCSFNRYMYNLTVLMITVWKVPIENVVDLDH